MRIKVYGDKKKINGTYDVNDIHELVKRLGISINEHIIVQNGVLVNENIKLKDGDEIKFLSVISGG